MDRSELQALAKHLLGEARAIRTAYPKADAMRKVTVSEVGGATFAEGTRSATLCAALGYLRAEMVLVRDGKAGVLLVLDDEIANAERLLLHL